MLYGYQNNTINKIDVRQNLWFLDDKLQINKSLYFFREKLALFFVFHII